VRVPCLWIAVLAQLGGCRVDFDERADGGPDAAPLGPWSAPRALTELNVGGSDEFGPWLSEDRLEIVFASNRTGGFLLYRARRVSPSDPFGAPVVIAIPGLPDGDDPFVTDDGLSLFFAETNGAMNLDIVLATRSSTTAEFSNDHAVTELDSTANDGGPALSSDELTIVFNSLRNGDEDLFIATRASKTSAWNAPALLDTVSIRGPRDCCPWLSGDGRLLVFASDRDTGRLQLYISEPGPTGFGTPAVLDPVLGSSDGDDGDPTLTRDQRTIVFASTRGGTDYNLYIADR
jgi:Tol biopolymer transport system component